MEKNAVRIWSIVVIFMSVLMIHAVSAMELVLPTNVKIVLERVYLDGEISEESFYETLATLDTFWETYADWELVEQTDDLIVLQKYVDDISPLLKINGYFGLSEDGILTIFDGDPKQEQIIQSFYYIDTEKLESTHYEELREGIPVLNRDHYREVLSMLKQYEIKM